MASGYAALDDDAGGLHVGAGALLIHGKNAAGSQQSVTIPTINLGALTDAWAWQVFYSVGNGPTVIFDATRRPLPEIPQPNDVATFPDPSSRTGRRVRMAAFAQQEGHGKACAAPHIEPAAAAAARAAHRARAEPCAQLIIERDEPIGGTHVGTSPDACPSGVL